MYPFHRVPPGQKGCEPLGLSDIMSLTSSATVELTNPDATVNQITDVAKLMLVSNGSAISHAMYGGGSNREELRTWIILEFDLPPGCPRSMIGYFSSVSSWWLISYKSHQAHPDYIMTTTPTGAWRQRATSVLIKIVASYDRVHVHARLHSAPSVEVHAHTNPNLPVAVRHLAHHGTLIEFSCSFVI